MAINNKKHLLLVIILFLFASFLYAQNAGYFVEENGDEVKYIQRFVWSGGEYALYYEVVFEREINGTYRSYLRETTTSQFIELSLSPGNYRFRVTPYDILGRPAAGSQWVNVQVLAVPPPEQPEEPEPELAIEEEPESEPETELEPDEPEKIKLVLFRIGAEGGMRLSVYGNKYFGDAGDGNIGLHTSIVFKLPLDMYVGPEFTFDVNRYGNIEYWKLYFYTFGLNILAEKWSPKKTFGVGFRAGVLYPTIDIQKNWHEMPQEQREYFKETNMGIIAAEEGFYPKRLIPNIGASLYWLIKKHFLVELGFNYIHVLPTKEDVTAYNYSASGFFCPIIRISYQF